MADSQQRDGPPLVTRDFVLIVVAHFLQALGYSSMLLLPLYLQHIGASRTEIGLAMGCAAIAGLLTRPLVGWGLDRWGRKPILFVGTVTVALGMALVGAVENMGPIIYVERVVFGLGVGALFTAYFTFAADLIPVARRTEGLALFGVSGLVPLLVNPLSQELGVAPADLRWFIPLLGLIVLSSLLALVPLPEPDHDPAARRPMQEALPALAARRLWPVWLATSAFSGLVAIFMTFATVAAERQGVPQAPRLWLTYALGAIVVRLVGARVPDRLGPANIVAPALGLYVAAMVVCARATTFDGFLAGALLAGIGHGYCFPVLSSQVVTRAPQTFRGSALAFFTALWGLSELATAPVFGAIADAHGDDAMFLTAAVGGIVSLAVWVLLEHRLGEASAQTG